jgi:hypothetical protein
MVVDVKEDKRQNKSDQQLRSAWRLFSEQNLIASVEILGCSPPSARPEAPSSTTPMVSKPRLLIFVYLP